MTTAIKTENLRKEFGNYTAVKGLTLQVEQGEVFGFLGPNGAGKTTSIKMLLDANLWNWIAARRAAWGSRSIGADRIPSRTFPLSRMVDRPRVSSTAWRIIGHGLTQLKSPPR